MTSTRPRFLTHAVSSALMPTQLRAELATFAECHRRLTDQNYHDDLDTKLSLLSYENHVLVSLLAKLIERTNRP